MKNALLAGSLFFASLAAHAQLTGNNLGNSMKQHEVWAAHETGANAYEAGAFVGYVAGAADALNGSVICAPKGTTLAQTQTVVTDYLKKHPDQWEKPAKALVLTALKQAYPCRKKRQ